MATTVIEVDLPNGTTVLARVQDLGGGATKTATADHFDFQVVGQVLEGLAQGLKESLEKAAPDKVTVTLGLELVTKAGKLTSLLVEGEATASLGVTLEWTRDKTA